MTTETNTTSYYPSLGTYPPVLGIFNGNTGDDLRSINENADFTSSSAYNIYYIDTTAAPILCSLNPTPVVNEVAELWDATGYASAHPISIDGNGHNIAGVASIANFIQADFGHAKLQFNGVQWLVH